MKRRMLLATVAALVLSLSTIDQASAQKKPITLPCPSDCIALGGERGDYFKHYGEPVREVLSGIWADLPLAVSDGTPANMKWVAEHPESYGLAQGNVYVQLADQYTGKLLILRSDGIGNEAVLAIVNEDRYKRAVEAGHGTPSWNYISANADKARFVTSTEASGPGSTFKQLQGLLDSNGLTKASKVQYLPNIDEALKAVVDGSAQVAFMVQAVNLSNARFKYIKDNKLHIMPVKFPAMQTVQIAGIGPAFTLCSNIDVGEAKPITTACTPILLITGASNPNKRLGEIKELPATAFTPKDSGFAAFLKQARAFSLDKAAAARAWAEKQ